MSAGVSEPPQLPLRRSFDLQISAPSRLPSLRSIGRAERFVFCRRPLLEPLNRVWKSSAAIIYQ
jgi:hypothetical protein